MNPISSADLARYRAGMAVTMTDEAVITRVGTTVKCRVTPTTRLIRETLISQLLPAHQWSLTFPYGTDVTEWDEITVGSRGTFVPVGVFSPKTIAAGIETECFRSAPAVAATTLRESGALSSLTASAGDTAHLNRLDLVSVGEVLELPVSATFMADTFGGPASQSHAIVCRWPATSAWANLANATEDYPVKVNDMVILPSGKKYMVRNVQNYAPVFLIAYVEMK